MLIDYPVLFWAILIGVVAVRMLTPLRSSIRKLYMKNFKQAEIDEYKDLRTQNITLASFTIVAIAIIGALQADMLLELRDAFFYFSIGMFCFFSASYLFTFRVNKWVPYTAETLEYVGIISLAIGFLYLISRIIPDLLLDIIYMIFFFGVVTITIYDLHLNKRFFYPKSTNG